MTYIDEARIHLDALERMIRTRGGLAAMELDSDPVLLMQLYELPRSRVSHLTIGCSNACVHERRFPNIDTLQDLLSASNDE